MFWGIIRRSCYENLLPEYTGEIQIVEFYPHCSTDDKCFTNKNHVDPDILI